MEKDNSKMRILIVAANALSKTSNNGKTYKSFLKGLSPEQIAQFYTGQNEYPDNQVCANYYRVTDNEILKSVLNGSLKTKNSHDLLMNSLRTVKLGELKTSRFKRFLKKHYKYIAPIRDWFWSRRTWDTEEFNKWICEFQPTHIFAVLGAQDSLHEIARTISLRYEIPLNVYFTDDYIINAPKDNILDKYKLSNIKKQYENTLKLAKDAFVIGAKMRDAYKLRFNRQFGILINGINFDQRKKNIRKRIKENESVIISFIGGIHLERWKSIVKLGTILNQIENLQVTLQVFCVSKPEDHILIEFEKAGVKYCGGLTAEQVDEEIKRSHILLHVESFDVLNRQYTHYSISTKIPEYMASMRGIIAYGPYEIASIQIFRDNKIGCVLTDLDDDVKIRLKLIEYIYSYNELDFDKQYEYARQHFNQNKMLLKDLLK